MRSLEGDLKAGMSSCIYHDADAVAICPSCDFGVCQACLDGGSEGVCQTCVEEREFRQKTSAVQREYTTEAVLPRCNYCRAAADDDTPLDADGYCPTCTILPRCVSHQDLIAVGPCKGCRRDFCRKCLGFTDVCPTCTANNRVKPKAQTKPMTAGGRSPTRPMGKGSRGVEAPAAKGKTGPIKGPPGPGGTGKMKGGKAAPAEEGKPKRGRGGKEAIEAKLQAQNGGNMRTQLAIAGVVLLLLLGGAFGFLKANASSPEEQARRLQEQMVAVHKAVLAHQSRLQHLPRNQGELLGSLAEASVPDRKHLKLVMRPQNAPPLNRGEPNTVYYQAAGDGFIVLATDAEGKLLTDAKGGPIMLDQFNPPAP